MQAVHTTLQVARLRVLALAVILVALAVLAAGAGTADAARSCSQDQVLIPYGSTANGSETDGYCIRAAKIRSARAASMPATARSPRRSSSASAS